MQRWLAVTILIAMSLAGNARGESVGPPEIIDSGVDGEILDAGPDVDPALIPDARVDAEPDPDAEPVPDVQTPPSPDADPDEALADDAGCACRASSRAANGPAALLLLCAAAFLMRRRRT